MSPLSADDINNFLEAIDYITKMKSTAMLDIEYDRTPHHRLHQLQNFLTELDKHPGCLGRDTQFKELQSSGYQFNPKHLVTSSNVCFQTEDSYASKHRALKTKKTNTWILCPVCDPFANRTSGQGEERTKKITIDGVAEEISIKSPLHCFYSTLNSSYVHHMAECHGVHGQTTFKTPFVGFTGSEMGLKVVCPYDGENGQPCLAMTPYNYQNGNGFKGYYRHVEKCHFGRPSKPKGPFYKSNEYFIPLDFVECVTINNGMADKCLNLVIDNCFQSLIDTALRMGGSSTSTFNEVAPVEYTNSSHQHVISANFPFGPAPVYNPEQLVQAPSPAQVLENNKPGSEFGIDHLSDDDLALLEQGLQMGEMNYDPFFQPQPTEEELYLLNIPDFEY